MSVLAGGFAVSQMLYVAARLKLADALAAGPVRVDALATLCDARPEPLRRVVRALSGFGVFQLDESDLVANTPMSDLLRAEADGSLREATLLYGDEHYHAMSELLQATTRGGTAFGHAYGRPHFSYLASNPEAAANYYPVQAAMRHRSARAAVQAVDFVAGSKVVEIAGGTGQILRAVLHANPSLLGVLAVSPGHALQAKSRIRADALDERCEVDSRDVLESVPRGGDAYILGHVLHELDDERAERLLGSCGRGLAAGGQLVIIERLLPEAGREGADSQDALLLDVLALAITGGRNRTEQEVRALVASAGLRVRESRRLESGDCLIIAAVSA
jgi:hypothetical protein